MNKKILAQAAFSIGLKNFSITEDGKLKTNDQFDNKLLLDKYNYLLEIEEKKTKGVYNGKFDTYIPLSKKDADGLLQVKAFFELGGDRTIFSFSNGKKIEFTKDNFIPFAKWFANERNKLFLN